jgi:peptidyl-prolyl cis-trans isomerase C
MNPSRSILQVCWGVLALVFLLAFLAACNLDRTSAPPAATLTYTPALPTATATPFQPSPTPQPLAAQVNGEGITVADFQAESARFQAAVGTQLATEDEKRVLDELINQALLAQAAAEAGFLVDDDSLQARIDQLITRLGSEQAFKDWMAGNGYTNETFRVALRRSIAAAWMRDQVIGSITETAEQVHARQILKYNVEEANQALAQLKSGTDFARLAAESDPVTGGDLGWFPRGYLTDISLENAAFSLQPGAYSNIIETAQGFHILLVIERDPSHPLEPDARLALQTRALQDWIEARRQQSDIQILIP